MKRLPTKSRGPVWAIVLGAALVATIAVVGRAAAEEPRTIADCEKIQAADAYNQCLAKFGPTSKLHNLEPERPGDVKASGAEAAATAAPLAHKGQARGRHGVTHRHAGGGGRKRAVFTVSRRKHK